MAEDVWADRARQVRPPRVPLENLPEADAAERTAARVEEQTRRRPPAQQPAACVRLIPPDPDARLVADRHQPLLAALADAGQVVLLEMQIGHPYADQLGDAEARGVEQLDHRAIPEAEGRRDVRLCDEDRKSVV